MELDPAKLNISQRSRVSRLPWKGQFSPELVEYFIRMFGRPGGLILDPFVGSGTVLFESLQYGARSIGIDANPAAYLLSRGSGLAEIGEAERLAILQQATSLLTSYGTQLRAGQEAHRTREFAATLNENRLNPKVRTLAHIALMLGIGDKKEPSFAMVQKGVQQASAFIRDLPFTQIGSHAFLGDARNLPSECDGVDLIITSPPYINVFNYHQNYRPLLELLGWKPLTAARAEIGANRKHRQNRLLTVIQYCLDMQQALAEMQRVLVNKGRLVLVIGRSSTVLRNTFYNADLLERLLLEAGGFEITGRQARVFTNRFGASIFEDVIVASKSGRVTDDLEIGRVVAVRALKEALEGPAPMSPDLLEEAVSDAGKISPSPFLLTESPLQ